MIGLLLSLSLALADCPEGLRPCKEAGADTGEPLGAVGGTTEAVPVLLIPDDSESPDAASLEATGPAPEAEDRRRYWYEPATDLLWLPGEVLYWIGLLGADHRDAAALGVLYALLHRLWLSVWAYLSPVVLFARERLGFYLPGPVSAVTIPEEVAREEVSEMVSACLDRHLHASDRQIKALQTQNTLLIQQVDAQKRANATLKRTSQRLLSAAYGAAGYPPGGPDGGDSGNG